MALSVGLTIWFVGRAAAANDSLLSRDAHPTWNLTNCAEVMLLGMLLVLPLPRFTDRTLWGRPGRAGQGNRPATPRTSLNASAAPSPTCMPW